MKYNVRIEKPIMGGLFVVLQWKRKKKWTSFGKVTQLHYEVMISRTIRSFCVQENRTGFQITMHNLSTNKKNRKYIIQTIKEHTHFFKLIIHLKIWYLLSSVSWSVLVPVKIWYSEKNLITHKLYLRKSEAKRTNCIIQIEGIVRKSTTIM
jgi:hypothetical protein